MKITGKILCAILVIAVAVCTLSLVGCNTSYDTDITGEGIYVKMDKVAAEINSKNIEDFVRTESVSDYVVFDVKDYGKIAVVLRDDIAPITVKNFKSLVKSGHYNGLIFHRVMETFMIQGGGYDQTNRLHSTPTIKGEFLENGVQNKLIHIPGVLSLARADAFDSGSAQFFIMTSTATHLDGSYAAFGYVLAGMDVVYDIAKCEVDNTDPNAPRPKTKVVINEAYFAEYVG